MSCRTKIRYLFDKYVPHTKKWDEKAMCNQCWYGWLFSQCRYHADGVKIAYNTKDSFMKDGNMQSREHVHVEVDNEIIVDQERIIPVFPR